MDENDYENELNDFLNAEKKKSNVRKAVKTDIVENDCTIRRDIDEANKRLLTANMHEWTKTVDFITTGEIKKDKNLTVVQHKGPSTKWQQHKLMIADDDEISAERTLAIFKDAFPPPQTNEGPTYEAELAQLQTVRKARAQHEQAMAKARMSRKIKAKNYSRHNRRREMRQFLLKEGDRTDNEEVRDRLDRLRAEERISMKHKTGGKFSKLIKLRAKYDERARATLDEMRETGRELTRKERDDDEEEDGDEEEDEDMEADEDEDSQEEVAGGDATMAVGRKEGAGLIKATAIAVRTETSRLVDINQPMIFDDDDEATTADMDLLREALFSSGQVEADEEEAAAAFLAEKAGVVAAEGVRAEETFVAGWHGQWTGPGTEARDRRMRQRGRVAGPVDETRRDRGRPRVWVRQGVHAGLQKHLVKTIPYPYNTAEQFEASRRQLVTAAFTMETVHRRATAPKARETAGRPIHPLRASEKARHQ